MRRRFREGLQLTSDLERDAVARAAGDQEPGDGNVRIRLFDADRTDRLLEFDAAMRLKPSERQLLWVDIEGTAGETQLARIRERFELDDATESALGEGEPGRPHVALHGRYFHVRLVAAPDPRRRDVTWLDVVTGSNVVITRHATPLELLEALDERISADATIGELDASDFVASLLDAVVTTYFAAVDTIEDAVDVIDAKALGQERFGELFGELIDIRRRVGRLRRLLARHRELFAVLGRGDFARGTGSGDPAAFQAVAARFESALTSVEETRELVLGSFEVLMTRTSQRTNDVMRVLTVATVLALPATLLAGFLGMNVMTPLPQDAPWGFWAVLALILVIEGAMLLAARARHWL